MVLGSSAAQHQIDVRYEGIASTETDTGVPGSAQLLAVVRTALSASPNPAVLATVAAELGHEATITALEVIAAFEMTNRVVEATGLPAPAGMRQRAWSMVEAIGADQFPHSGVAVAAAGGSSTLRRRLKRVKAKLTGTSRDRHIRSGW